KERMIWTSQAAKPGDTDPGIRRVANEMEIHQLPGEFVFKLSDTYGFPLDLTELMARERGLKVDIAGFEKLLKEQQGRSIASQKKQVIEVSRIKTETPPTKFVGYDHLEGAPANVLDVHESKGKTAVILDSTPFYAAMGGQVGDTGSL